MSLAGKSGMNRMHGIIASSILHVLILSFLFITGTAVKREEFASIKVIISGAEELTGKKPPTSGENRPDIAGLRKKASPAVHDNHPMVIKTEEAGKVKKPENTPDTDDNEQAHLMAEDIATRVQPAGTEIARINKDTKTWNENSVINGAVDPMHGGGDSLASFASRDKANKADYEGWVYTGRFGSGNGPGFIKQEIPVYPLFARRMGKEGRVVLKLLIDELGHLMKVEVLEGAGFGFDRSAVEAIRDSSFRPATLNGMPVKSRTRLPVRFVLK